MLFITPIAQEITRIVGSLCQELRTKTKYIFLIISHYHSLSFFTCEIGL